MGKKLVILLLALIIGMSFMLFGCNSKPLEILYLGDSIAEGIAGMSPISERDRYSYFGLIGLRNGYIYRNRGVSGYRSSALLNLVKQEDVDIRMTQSYIRSADIIHISILGNDLLLNDLGQIMISVAQDDYTKVNSIVEQGSENFAEIISVIRGYNKKATLFYQNVYNPVFEDTWLISQAARDELASIGVEPADYRALAQDILDRLAGIAVEYLEEHPGEFHLIDSLAEFDRVYKENPERGKRLISVDCAHPSSEGHAILADSIQNKLEEIGLADKAEALKNYKDIKKDQLERLYPDTVDVKEVSATIDQAKSCSQVTEIYFNAIYGKIPVY